MPRLNIVKSVSVTKTPRISQIESIFDVLPSETSTHSIDVNLPIDGIDWQVGVIVGPSGCGKTTVAKELFPDSIIHSFEWQKDKSILDCFDKNLSIKDISKALSSVGFSTPPSWLRPFHVLSNGEQFRATMARAILESGGLFVIDEFTSVVDRRVAQIGSFAFSKSVRKTGKQFIAVSCHYDILDWLEPDWIYEPHTGDFKITRGELRRPEIPLEIKRVHHSAWRIFSKHHYMSADINKSAQCYCAFIDDVPVAFTAVLSFPHPKKPGWREHRTVCLPDFQGVGIGNALSDFVAGMYSASKPYSSNTANSAMIGYRNKSSKWAMIREPSFTAKRKSAKKKAESIGKTTASSRYTASFRYVGDKNTVDAKGFGII